MPKVSFLKIVIFLWEVRVWIIKTVFKILVAAVFMAVWRNFATLLKCPRERLIYDFRNALHIFCISSKYSVGSHCSVFTLSIFQLIQYSSSMANDLTAQLNSAKDFVTFFTSVITLWQFCPVIYIFCMYIFDCLRSNASINSLNAKVAII